VEDFPFEGLEAAGGGLHEQEMFAGSFDFSLPAIDGFDWGDVDVDAGGEVFLDGGAGDFAGLGKRGAGNEDQAELCGHGFWRHCSGREDFNTEVTEGSRGNGEGEAGLRATATLGKGKKAA
jgi:hypothetical protein